MRLFCSDVETSLTDREIRDAEGNLLGYRRDQGDKMALTYNRPDYTATQLNTIWTTLRNGLAAVMPSAIETVAGQSNFSVIDIYDTGTSSNIGLSCRPSLKTRLLWSLIKLWQLVTNAYSISSRRKETK